MQRPYRLLKSPTLEIHIVSGVFTSIIGVEFYNTTLCGTDISELKAIPEFSYLTAKNVKTAIDSLDGLACKDCKEVFDQRK